MSAILPIDLDSLACHGVESEGVANPVRLPWDEQPAQDAQMANLNEAKVRAALPAHPEYVALSAMRDAAQLRAFGRDEEALHRIESAWRTNPASEVLASEAVRMYANGDATEFAQAKIQAAKEALADGGYDVSRCLLAQAGTLLALVDEGGSSSERYAWVRRELLAARRQVAESQGR